MSSSGVSVETSPTYIVSTETGNSPIQAPIETVSFPSVSVPTGVGSVMVLTSGVITGEGERDASGVRLRPGVSIVHPAIRRHTVTIKKEKRTWLFIVTPWMAIRQVILML